MSLGGLLILANFVIAYGLIVMLWVENNEIHEILSDHNSRITSNYDSVCIVEDRINDHGYRFTELADTERDLEVRNLTVKAVYSKPVITTEKKLLFGND